MDFYYILLGLACVIGGVATLISHRRDRNKTEVRYSEGLVISSGIGLIIAGIVLILANL